MDKRIKLVGFTYHGGLNIGCNVTVFLDIDDKVSSEKGPGVGPVDAAFKVICEILKRPDAVLVDFTVHAANQGSSEDVARVDAFVSINGRKTKGSGYDRDTLVASVAAIVDAFNEHLS